MVALPILEGALQPPTLETVIPGNPGVSRSVALKAPHLLGLISALTSIMLPPHSLQTIYTGLAKLIKLVLLM